jgi:hypothetical protein
MPSLRVYDQKTEEFEEHFDQGNQKDGPERTR